MGTAGRSLKRDASQVPEVRSKSLARSLNSTDFDPFALVVSALIQSGQIHVMQSRYFLNYSKQGTPKRSLAFGSQGERFKLSSCAS
jgi:hypothetical protein